MVWRGNTNAQRDRYYVVVDIIYTADARRYRYCINIERNIHADLTEVIDIIYTADARRYRYCINLERNIHADLTEVTDIIYTADARRYRHDINPYTILDADDIDVHTLQMPDVIDMIQTHAQMTCRRYRCYRHYTLQMHRHHVHCRCPTL